MVDARNFYWWLRAGIHFLHKLLLLSPFCPHLIGDSMKHSILNVWALKGLALVCDMVL